MKTEDFDELVASIHGASRIRRGEQEPSGVTEYPPLDPKAIHHQLKKSQEEFAQLIGVSVSELRAWERWRKQPVGPALILLRIAAKNPETVLAAMTL